MLWYIPQDLIDDYSILVPTNDLLSDGTNVANDVSDLCLYIASLGHSELLSSLMVQCHRGGGPLTGLTKRIILERLTDNVHISFNWLSTVTAPEIVKEMKN